MEFEVTRLWECAVRSGSQGGSLRLGIDVGIGGVDVKLVLARVGVGVGCVLDEGEGESGMGCIGGGGGWGWGGAWRRGEELSGEAVGEIGVGTYGCGGSDPGEQGSLAGVVGGSRADTGGARGRGPTVVAKNAWIGSADDCWRLAFAEMLRAILCASRDVPVRHDGPTLSYASTRKEQPDCVTVKLSAIDHESKSWPYEHTGNGVRGACYGCGWLSFLAGDRAIALFTGMAEGRGPLLLHRVAGDGRLVISAVVALLLFTLACSLLFGWAFNGVVLAGQKRRARPAKRTRLGAGSKPSIVSARLGCRRTRCAALLCWVPVAGGVADGVSVTAVFENRDYLEIAVTEFIANADDATSPHGPISEWDVSKVTDMSKLFKGKGEFNEDISGWNTSRVTNMGSMFEVRVVCTYTRSPFPLMRLSPQYNPNSIPTVIFS